MSSQGDLVHSSSGFWLRSDGEELCGKVNEDFVSKLKIDEAYDGVKLTVQEGEPSERHDSCDSLESDASDEGEGEGEDEEDDGFSFPRIMDADTFQDGQIRPTYPLFGRILLFNDYEEEVSKSTLKKVFVEKAELNELEGADSVWSGKTVEELAPPESCSKSNSTGFSKLWRFKDLVRRSNSDGKDAYVFLKAHRSRINGGKDVLTEDSGNISREKVGKTTARKNAKVKVKKAIATAKQGEKNCASNRNATESRRWKSFLPYRQNLVGVGVGRLASVTCMSKNVHPF
ncbi:hypothetical protein SAY87_020162 [Trapa incisa]|uniref:Uncharacterized protein n=1 Tax=Trapa incisa TaxID=236973 RepID=A0AAN7K323_9MYRT|nr:hypothetical protein SAY87_020162 [Trapa incisa]